MSTTRRRFLLGATALSSTALAGAQPSRYQLGCETLPYRGLPITRAIEGIRKAGYRYVMPYHTHAGEAVFAPSTPPAQRAQLRRQFQDAGLEPFMSFVGLMKNVTDPEGLKIYLGELDLCAEFGIRTVVAVGPWYFDKFPNIPKRAREWEKEVAAFYAAMERPIRHAESVGVTIALKPHTGITATARTSLDVLKRLVSDRLKICWDAGNVSYYEGIHPDPDLPDLAPHVRAVCVKDHRGLRGDADFPTPGEGQVDHELMFRTLFGAGFHGPIAVERVDGRDNAMKMEAEIIDQRIAKARQFIAPLLEKCAA
jgi:sugar phosphate isomerase/epimerase